KIESLKQDFFSYIDQNSGKIDTNLPVFFGHVIAQLERSFPDMDNTTYDEFIDAMAYRIMEASPRSGSIGAIEQIIKNALRFKRNGRAKGTLDILAGLELMSVGNFNDAIPYLRPYAKHDALIGLYVAYCYMRLSAQETRHLPESSKTRPSEMELAAREQLLEMLRTKPPISRLRQLHIADNEFLEQACWAILGYAIEWFPNEPWFLRIGLEKTKKDNNEDMRERLLKIGGEKFFNDMFFLRELYQMRLERKDGAGTAGVVKQMMQQYPDSSEPLYFGIKLALLSGSPTSFRQFREKAVDAGMPVHLIYFFDFAFAFLTKDMPTAQATLAEMKRRFGSLKYYLSLIEYVFNESQSGDEGRAKRAKRVFFDSFEAYTFQVLRIQE
ncbi:MAG: hypothetical protein APR53_00460, partial [Methanoculleus sp. SDB]